MDCRVILAQTNPALGDRHNNLDDHLARVESAVERGADLIVFPELSLTGYFLKDQTAEVALPLDAPEVEQLAACSRRISIAFGMVERSPEGRLYNAMVFLEDGAVLAVHRKVHLVGYGMFDEVRDFAAGEAFEPIASRHGRFGVLTCEDAWHVPGAYLHFLSDVDVILVPSSGPARGAEAPGPGFASSRVWGTLLTALALGTQTYVLYVNRVGFEDGVAFGGETQAIDPFGQPAGRIEGLGTGELDLRLRSTALRRARVQTPLRRDAKPWILAAALERHLRHGESGP